jgi:L-lactate dehydrogenase (cytochrome)
MSAATVAEFQAIARRRLPRFLVDYLEGGAITEQTLRRNERDFADIAIEQRVLRDISAVDTRVHLFGQEVAMPVVLAPVGMAGMYGRRGEHAAAEAAAAAGIPFTLSTVSICEMGEVFAGAPAGAHWFQLYVTKDRGLTQALVERAREMRAGALVVTVDMPLPGIRYRDRRSGLSGPTGWAQKARLYAQAAARPGWALNVGLRGRPHVFGNLSRASQGDFSVGGFWSWMSDNFDPTVTWTDIEAIRRQWTGPLIIKGILHPDDAKRAVALGANGIVVSNHGGRQLDGAATAVAVLPAIRDASGDMTVLVDGGVRSGVDVYRAVRRGAHAVMIGRPWVYALAADGQRGVATLLETFRREFSITLALSGERL